MSQLYRFLLSSLILLVLWSCEDIIEVPDISNDRVQLLAPSNESVVINNDVNFNWTLVADAESYEIQVSTPSFANASQILVDTIINVDSIQPGNQISRFLENNSYEWRVKAFNSGFSTEFSSSSFLVNVEEEEELTPNRPELTAPVNGAQLEEQSVMFSWSRTDLANSQERDSVFIFSDVERTELVIKALGSNKSYTTNLDDGTYHWVVRAYNQNDEAGEESIAFNFTVATQ